MKLFNFDRSIDKNLFNDVLCNLLTLFQFLSADRQNVRDLTDMK